MKHLLLADIRSYNRAINKDMMGGMGTGSDFQSSNFSLISHLLQYYKAKSVFLPNLTLAYLSAIFKNNGWKVDVTYNKAFNDPTTYDIVIIYGSIPEFKNEREFAVRIKKQQPHVKVGFIGTLATVRPEIYKNVADFVIIGQADLGLNNIDLNQFNFLGHIKFNTFEQSIDELPFPDWHPFLAKRHFLHKPLLDNKPMLSMYTSRGCPLTCRYYCPYPLQQGRKLHLRKIENIISEINYIKTEYGISRILFRDPNFGFKKDYLRELLDAFIDNNTGITWAAEMHLDSLDEELICQMKKSGCKSITVGIESSDKTILGSVKRKNAEQEKLQENLKLLEKNHIRVMAGYILGYPNDTPESLKRTFEYAKRLNTSYAQFTISTPYIGTQFYNDIEKDIFEHDIEAFNGYRLTFNHPNFSKNEIESLKSQFFKCYYLRIPWIIKHLKEMVA